MVTRRYVPTRGWSGAPTPRAPLPPSSGRLGPLGPVPACPDKHTTCTAQRIPPAREPPPPRLGSGSGSFAAAGRLRVSTCWPRVIGPGGIGREGGLVTPRDLCAHPRRPASVASRVQTSLTDGTRDSVVPAVRQRQPATRVVGNVNSI